MGVGEQAKEGFINNNSMGGVGLANPSVFQINNVNPALLSYNRVTSFNLGVGTIYNVVKGNGISQKSFNGNLQYLSLAFPVAKKYTIGLGLQPFSTVNYNYSTIEKIENTDDAVKYSKKGDGGLTSVYLSQGFKINKNFAIGLKTSYIFGSINSYTSSQILFDDEVSVEKDLSTNYRGLIFKPGVSYRAKFKDNLFLNVGATYQFASQLSSTETLISQRKGEDGAIYFSDTVSVRESGKVTYPGSVGIGIGIEKAGKWSVGLDFNSQQWSRFKGTKNDNFKNSYSIALGGEIMPNHYSENFLKRMGVRAGVSYSKTRISYSNSQLDDLSFSMGASVPIKSLSFIDISATYGMYGKPSADHLSENYFKFSLGISISDRNWFVRRKYE